MFRLFRKRNRLTPQQEKAEKEAIRLLTQAQQILKDDPNNAEEAKRIRFEVTHNLLPKHKMYIMRKHPQSLLKDLDIKIQHAYVHQIRNAGQVYEEDAPVVQSAETKRACDFWANRYGSAKGNAQRQLYWSIACLTALSILVLFLLMKVGSSGGGSFSSSFNWLSK